MLNDSAPSVNLTAPRQVDISGLSFGLESSLVRLVVQPALQGGFNRSMQHTNYRSITTIRALMPATVQTGSGEQWAVAVGCRLIDCWKSAFTASEQVLSTHCSLSLYEIHCLEAVA